jgi:pilus assembly protein CpaB
MDRRKILILFGAAWLSAALLSWFLYARTKAPRQEARVRIAAASRDMALGSRIGSADIRWISMAQREIPKGAVLQEKTALNRALLYPVSAGEPLTTAKLSQPGSIEGVAATIEPGYRAVSVPVTETSGAAGLIQPNSRVDVIFTRPGSMAEAITSTILENVRVLSLGRATQSGQNPAPDAKGAAPRNTVATLVVTPEMAQKLELAKNQGKISLVLRNPLDNGTSANPGPVTTEVLDPMVSARLARARRGRTTNVRSANLDDPRVWQELTGERKPPRDEEKVRAEEEARKRKEAERPRVVIDVYRGDKHVQELFR